MAEFLSKENINVSSGSQSTFNMNAGSLAQDLQTLMGSVSAIGKDVVKTGVSESEKIGSMLATDMLIGLSKQKTEIYEGISKDERNYDYYGSIESLTATVANNLKDAKDRLGTDSVAYKKFEDSYLMRATEYTEGIKTSLWAKNGDISRKNLNDATDKRLNDGMEIKDTAMVAEWIDSYKQTGMTSEQISAKITNSAIGYASSISIDPKLLYNKDGSPNLEKQRATFNSLMNGMFAINKKGDLVALQPEIQAEHLDGVKRFWKQAIHIEKEKAESNDIYKLVEYIEKKNLQDFVPSSDPQKDKEFFEKVYKNLDDAYNSTAFNSKSTTLSFEKTKTDLSDKLREFDTVYNVSRNPADVAIVMQTGVITTADGENKKVDKKMVESVIQTRYNDNIDKITADGIDELTRKQNLDSLVAYQNQTGIVPAKITATIKNLEGMNFSSVADLQANIKIVETLRAKGYDVATTNPSMSSKNLGLISAYIDSNKDKPMSEIKIGIANINGTAFAQSNITKQDTVINLAYDIKKLLNDKSKLESALKGGWGVASKFSIDNFVSLNDSIVGGVDSISKEASSFLTDNHIDVRDATSAIEVLAPKNQDTIGIFTGDYMFSVLKVQGNGVLSAPVNKKNILGYLKDEGFKEFNKDDDIGIKYANNPLTKEFDISIYKKTGNILDPFPIRKLGYDDIRKINNRALDKKLKEAVDSSSEIIF